MDGLVVLEVVLEVARDVGLDEEDIGEIDRERGRSEIREWLNVLDDAPAADAALLPSNCVHGLVSLSSLPVCEIGTVSWFGAGALWDRGDLLMEDVFDSSEDDVGAGDVDLERPESITGDRLGESIGSVLPLSNWVEIGDTDREPLSLTRDSFLGRIGGGLLSVSGLFVLPIESRDNFLDRESLDVDTGDADRERSLDTTGNVFVGNIGSMLLRDNNPPVG